MNLRKYLIMGSQNCDRDPADILELSIKSGVTAFQFREKGVGSLKGNDKLELGYKLRNICAHHNIAFFVNDDIDLVEPLGADGIHVGQDHVSVEKLRARFPNKIIGLSVSNPTEVSNSPIQLADYLGAGPIFNTSTKPDAKSEVGVNWIKTLRNQFPSIPIVGIGGITTQNAASVINAGADGVAVISAVIQANDVKTAVQGL
ncbi:thiamine phosphate synthase [Virgibacillus sp. JSM 102003]|uniref:thiamine phosphate synthase n=1 Tax=Virgibacillus sp. JSM 102003 TaxID=1562108 RepID=UPI0035C15A5A